MNRYQLLNFILKRMLFFFIKFKFRPHFYPLLILISIYWCPYALGTTMFDHSTENSHTVLLTNSPSIPEFGNMPQQQEEIEVIGTVRDSTALLSGVTIMVKDKSNISTSSDRNGKFVLTVPKNSVLVFRLIGYETQEIPLNGRNKLEINLSVSQTSIEDVVVTGFGTTTRKTDMVGSVTSVKPSELKVPSSNLTTSLAGRVSGMIAYQRSGEPGMDNADFFIRGVTTFGYKVDPLILIDNVEMTTTDLARLQVDDLESFEILKDATSTAIYGARGANGVILVSTKRGRQGRTQLSFRLENSLSRPISTVKFADPITYMKMANEAVLTRNPNGATFYPINQIERTAEGADPYLYPAVDWQQELMKDYTSTRRANLSIRGGGEVAQFFVSGAYNQDLGILKVPSVNNFNNNINLKTYSLRSNIDMQLTKTTDLQVNLNGVFDDYNGPISGGTAMYNNIVRTSPSLFPAYYPAGSDQAHLRHIMFGNYGEGNYMNPYAELVKGYRQYSRSMMLAQLQLKQNLSFITEGLSFRSMANTTRNAYFDVDRQYIPFYYHAAGINPITNYYDLELLNEQTGTEYLDYNEGDKTVSTVFYMENALNYSRTFADRHAVSALLVTLLRNRLNGNSGSLQESLPFRNVGLSGKATYAYDSRYYLDLNFGFNGSERFFKSERFGFFPSVGVAWSISNEKFWEPLKSVVNTFRLRSTYGVIGNDAIASNEDRFLYLSEIDMDDAGRSATFGTDLSTTRPGISMVRYANPKITWEKSYQTNFATDIGLFNDKLQIIAEYFMQRRENIYMPRADIPSTVGLVPPRNGELATVSANLGEARSKGFEFSLDYKHSLANSLWIQARGNFTYATNKYTVYEEPIYQNEPWLSRINQSIGQQWGYIAERLFVDDLEVSNSPEQTISNLPVRGGDIKYRDVNSDGRISSLDRVPIGYPTTPEIIYGGGFSIGFKGFDLSAFFQGSARSSFWIDPEATYPFRTYVPANQTRTVVNGLLEAYANDYWSEENGNIYALWPRLGDVVVTNNTARSTWFMRNGAFVRLKQATLGYTFPSRITERIKMSSLRIYVEGNNLLTFSGFKLWDPEMAGNGLGYPIQQVFNFGINASF